MRDRVGKALGRLQQRRENTQQELLEAARRVIAFNGYYNTKIADIARAAGVGVGTFYLYYPTKQAIFLELIEESGRRLREVMDRLRAEISDPAEFAQRSMETFLRFAQDNRELFRIVFSHRTDFPDVIKTSQELFIQETVDNLRAGMDSGVFRRNHPEIVAQGLVGMTLQIVSWWLEHESVPIETVTAALGELASHGISAETKSRGEACKTYRPDRKPKT